MPILTGKILDVRATKKKDEQMKGLNVNVALEDFKPEADKATIRYTYSLSYEPGVATMQVLGELIVQFPKDKMKECREKWEKEKNLPLDVAEEILTAITYTGTAVGTLLAFAIGVNAPINIPRAKLAPAAPTRPVQ